MKIDEAIARYRSYLQDERSLSERTIKGYGYELSMFATMVGEDREVKDIVRDEVVAFLNQPGPDGSPLRPASRNRKLIVLRGFFKYLQREKILRIETPPTLQIEWVKVPQIQAPCLTWHDYQALLASFPEKEGTWMQLRDRCLVTMLFHTGIRVHELVSLEVGQVDVAGGTLMGVKRKGNSIQTLPVNSAVLKELHEWFAVRESRAPKTEHLFIGRGGKGLGVRQVERRLVDLGKRAGIAIPVTPHALRHLHATELIQRGVNLEVVRRLLNHKSIKTTQRYSHVAFDSLREAVQRLVEDRS